MSNYTRFAKDAAKRRKVLTRQLTKARKVVEDCVGELEVLRQVISALKGIGSAAARVRGRSRGRKGRRGGKWKPGKPGRPPEWWREKQKAKKGGKRRGRKAAAATA